LPRYGGHREEKNDDSKKLHICSLLQTRQSRIDIFSYTIVAATQKTTERAPDTASPF
jgi:hypothetical protein